MLVRRAISNARKSLRRHKVQSALSLLGIIIGVFSVTLIVSLGLGLRSFIVAEIEQYGNTFISIAPAVPGLSGQGTAGGLDSVFVTTLDVDDMEALEDKKNFPYITAVTGIRSDQAILQAGNKEEQSIIIGTTPDYLKIDPQTKVEHGRFFTDNENKAMAQVIVIGPSVATQLFGSADPIGKNIRAKGIPLQVIGVLESRGQVAFVDFDTLAFIPLRLAQKRITGLDHLSEIDVQISDVSLIPQAEEDIARMIRRRHGIKDPNKDDFVVVSATEIREQVDTITGALTVLLGFLSAISLLVGGIGIMNIMLVAVAERIREVGLRRALGARPEDIRLQFLSESVILTTVGGLLGGLLGFIVTMILVAVARHFGFAVPYLLSLPAFGVAGLVSVVIGVIFGLYPAKKASELDPISALRFQ